MAGYSFEDENKNMEESIRKARRKPAWLKVTALGGQSFNHVNSVLRRFDLNTVCQSANCPNRGECFSSGTATFLILGNQCTRNCTFCNINYGIPSAPDLDEPSRVAAAAEEIGLKHVVVTSVTRDDLPDGGISQFVATVLALKERIPSCTVEILTPDFQAVDKAAGEIIACNPDVFNHNIETVKRLYPRVRPRADYNHSLNLLKEIAQSSSIKIKSGIMLGLGEQMDELYPLFEDLANSHVSILTIGQYLAPSPKHYPVARYVSPEEFFLIGTAAKKAGIQQVVSGPLVRSSYKASASL